jgi:hypothetical protein
VEPTVEQSVDTLVDSIEDFARRAKPSVREIFITQEVEAICGKWRIEDLDVLNPTYLDTLRATKQKLFDDETRALDTEIKPQFKPLRDAIGERLASARRIPLESERVNPDTAPQHFATARLLDEFATDRAEKWLGAHENDLAAIEARYQASDDRRDAAFVRLVEERFGLTSETPVDESSNVVPMPLCQGRPRAPRRADSGDAARCNREARGGRSQIQNGASRSAPVERVRTVGHRLDDPEGEVKCRVRVSCDGAEPAMTRSS